MPSLWRRGWDIVWVPAAAVLLALALEPLPPVRLLDRLARDAQANAVAPARQFNDVLVIDIDDPSLQALAPFFGSWPYARDTYALLIDYLGEMGAQAVVLDLVLADPRAGDAALRQAIGRNTSVVLAASARGEGTPHAPAPAALQGLAWSRPEGLGAQAWPDAQVPLADFTQPAPRYARVGVVTAVPDADGVLRRLPLLHQVHGMHLPTLPLAGVFANAPTPTLRLSPDMHTVEVGALRLPVDAQGQVRLWFPDNAAHALTTLPFTPVAHAMLGVAGQTLPPALFQGKTVYLGSSAFFSDRVDTPAGEMRGVYVIALAHALLQQGGVLRAPVAAYGIGWLLLALLPALWAGVRPTLPLQRLLSLSAGTAALIYGGQMAVLSLWQQESAPMQALLALLIASTLAITRLWRRHQAQQDSRIEMLLHDDALTQLPNRLSMQAQLAHAIADAQAHGTSLAVLVLDLDRFKTVNDALGHAVGDQMLVRVSQCLRQHLPSAHVLARLGGDEFGIILLHTDAAGATQQAQQLITALDGSHRRDPQVLHITTSAGISLYPQDGADAATLLRCADAALHQAKHEGGNTYRLSTPALSQSAREQLWIETELRHALTQETLVLHYQPQLDLRSGQIVAVEALLRWPHPERGLMAPDRFIPVAEKSDLILSLDAWVLQTACRQMRAWQLAGLTSLRQVAVNLSARQFDRADLPALVAQVLAHTQLDAAHLELEITESLAMRDPEHTIATLQALRGMGVALTVDDFGTGHSSFSYLKLFPISCVKIDRSFVRDIATDPHDAAICAATLALAQQLGLDTVAEGVETDTQRQRLAAEGCHKIQGYLVSPALAAAELHAFCQQHPARP